MVRRRRFLLASLAAHLNISVPRGDWLPPTAESVGALHTLEEMDQAGIVQSLRVILDLPTDSIADTNSGWNPLDRVTKGLAADPLRPLRHRDSSGYQDPLPLTAHQYT